MAVCHGVGPGYVGLGAAAPDRRGQLGQPLRNRRGRREQPEGLLVEAVAPAPNRQRLETRAPLRALAWAIAHFRTRGTWAQSFRIPLRPTQLFRPRPPSGMSRETSRL